MKLVLALLLLLACTAQAVGADALAQKEQQQHSFRPMADAISTALSAVYRGAVKPDSGLRTMVIARDFVRNLFAAAPAAPAAPPAEAVAAAPEAAHCVLTQAAAPVEAEAPAAPVAAVAAAPEAAQAAPVEAEAAAMHNEHSLDQEFSEPHAKVVLTALRYWANPNGKWQAKWLLDKWQCKWQGKWQGKWQAKWKAKCQAKWLLDKARRTDIKADDCAMLLRIVVALLLGFLVDVKAS
ncbi:hypothetical protein JKP88DRAFT_288688 [Tribonema minus]|uniref:Uncharacterized protein n=1 Tax=Tribonema minus TaxID=303371 RepID=A0A836CIC4_9STRA|nr:hypothetical protein JKP88DRAFT_288688 [Tribonema minus]